jgi:MazG family protein
MKKNINDLISIIKTLHSPNGCPWDRKQKIANYKEYVVEEVYELLEAIDSGKSEAVCEELGDVLLLIVTLAHMYDKKSLFDFSDVVDGIANKMVARHPHVFAGKKARNAEEVIKHWMEQKSKEKSRKTLKERLPKTAPALLKSRVLFKEMKYTGKADDVRFSGAEKRYLKNADKMSKSDINEVLFYLAHAAYKKGMNPEETLRARILKEAARHKY